MLKTMVDTLATRYGWFYNDILERMYWEDVYECWEHASNLNAIEKNSEMKFEFMLHAQSKDALDKWSDLPVPFPHPDWTPPAPRKVESNIPRKLRHVSKKDKASPERLARIEHVKKRLAEHKVLKRERRKQYYGGV